jgi:type IV secretory pathway TrbF-like protein
MSERTTSSSFTVEWRPVERRHGKSGPNNREAVRVILQLISDESYEERQLPQVPTVISINNRPFSIGHGK